MKAVRENIANLVPHKKTSFMINLQIEGLTKSFGDRVLFADIAFGLSEGERVGLIAKNGTGKTTLLNIIAGDESYDSGTITFRNGIRVGYLRQLPFYRPVLQRIAK